MNILSLVDSVLSMVQHLQQSAGTVALDPENKGDFVSVATEDGRASVSGINNNLW